MNDYSIPTQEVLDDIQDTETEIKNMREELDVLMRNPAGNKLRIYMLKGGISRRVAFVEKLRGLLEKRQT